MLPYPRFIVQFVKYLKGCTGERLENIFVDIFLKETKWIFICSAAVAATGTFLLLLSSLRFFPSFLCVSCL